MSTIKELFSTATNSEPKAVRREAFQRLRYLSLYGDAAEQEEAKLALAHTVLYQEHDGDVAAVRKALEKGNSNGEQSRAA